MVVLLAILALAASPKAPTPYRLLGAPANVAYPSLKACERAWAALMKEQRKQPAEASRLARLKGSSGSRWTLDPICLPW